MSRNSDYDHLLAQAESWIRRQDVPVLVAGDMNSLLESMTVLGCILRVVLAKFPLTISTRTEMVGIRSSRRAAGFNSRIGSCVVG